MAKNADRLRSKIAELEAQLKEAEAKERQEEGEKIVTAAEKSGLIGLKLSARELRQEFDQIVKNRENKGTTNSDVPLPPQVVNNGF